jgi:Protein of unknown function (DUF3999)
MSLPLFLLAAAVPAAFGAPWTAWHDIYPLSFVPVSATAYVRVPLDALDTGEDGAYPGVRIVDDAGTETPFAIDPNRETPSNERTLSITDTGFVRGSYSQAVIDFGPQQVLHNGVRIATTRDTYLEHVSVESSDDQTAWRAARGDAVIYQVAGDAPDSGNQTISFPATRSRWLRLRVLDPSQAFPISTAYEDTRPPREALADVAPLLVATADGAGRQRWQTDFGNDYREGAAVSVLGGTVAFARPMTVETSDDGTNWTALLDRATVTRDPRGLATIVPFEHAFAKHWRVTIDNGNDTPVEGLSVTLLAPPHVLVFSAHPGHSYALLAGNPAATAPRYDLGELLAQRDWHADQIAYTPGHTTNGAFIDPRSITERVPWLVDAGFVLASLIIGALALTTVRAAMKQQQSETATDASPEQLQ